METPTFGLVLFLDILGHAAQKPKGNGDPFPRWNNKKSCLRGPRGPEAERQWRLNAPVAIKITGQMGPRGPEAERQWRPAGTVPGGTSQGCKGHAAQKPKGNGDHPPLFPPSNLKSPRATRPRRRKAMETPTCQAGLPGRLAWATWPRRRKAMETLEPDGDCPVRPVRGHLAQTPKGNGDWRTARDTFHFSLLGPPGPDAERQWRPMKC